MMINLPSGFLSPTAQFIPCSYLEHWAEADEICIKNKWDWLYSPIDELVEKHGFVHMAYSFLGRKEWNVMWANHLTTEQIHFLKPFFEANKNELNVAIGRSSRAKFECECDK